MSTYRKHTAAELTKQRAGRSSNLPSVPDRSKESTCFPLSRLGKLWDNPACYSMGLRRPDLDDSPLSRERKNTCLYGKLLITRVSLWNTSNHKRVCTQYHHSNAYHYGKPPLIHVSLWKTSTHKHKRVFMEYSHSHARLYGILSLTCASLWNIITHTRVFME